MNKIILVEPAFIVLVETILPSILACTPGNPEAGRYTVWGENW